MASTIKKPPAVILDNIHVLDGGGYWLNDFIQDMEIEAQLKIGMIASFITTGTYPIGTRVFVKPFKTNTQGIDEDAAGTLARQSKADDRVTEMMVQWELQKPAMIQFILKYLSPESRNKLKEDVGFRVALTASDSLTVWNILLKVHYPGFDVASTLGQSAAANNAYYQLRMGDTSLADFKRDYVMVRGVRKTSGNEDVSETQAAWDFVWKLDPNRYGNFAAYCNNQIAAGSIAESSFTLNKVFDLLTKYKVEANPVQSKGPQVAFPVNIAEVSDPKNMIAAIVMATRALEAATLASNTQANRGSNFNRDNRDQQKNRLRRSKSKTRSGYSKSPGPNREIKLPSNKSSRCSRCNDQGHSMEECNAFMHGRGRDRVVLLSHEAVDADRFELKALDNKGIAAGVFASFLEDKSTQQYPVLIDNQSEVSIIHAAFLQDIKPLSSPITIFGIGGAAVQLKHKGRLPLFDLECYASYENLANIICYADVAAKFPITSSARAFVVHLPEKDVVFALEGKLYIASLNEFSKTNLEKQIYFSTVSEIEKLYTEKERKMAKKAWQFAKRSLAPSLEEAIRLATFGNIRNVDFTATDLRRAYDIYGKPIEAIKARMTKKKIARQEIEVSSNWTDRPQDLTMDLFFIDQHIFLLTVTSPLQLTIVSKCPGRDARSLHIQLQHHLDEYKTRRFDIKQIYDIRTIHADSESGFKVLQGKFPGIKIDIGSPGAHAERADERIRRVKELCRQVVNSIPWQLPEKLLDDMVRYATIRLNMFLGHDKAVPSKVDFSGMKPSLEKEYGLTFGEFCMVHNNTAQSNNVFSPRAKACIALWPESNSQGSWRFYCIDTDSNLSGAVWDALPTPQLVIDKMDALAEKNAVSKESFGKPERLASSSTNPRTESPSIYKESLVSSTLKPSTGKKEVSAPMKHPTAKSEVSGVNSEVAEATRTDSRFEKSAKEQVLAESAVSASPLSGFSENATSSSSSFTPEPPMSSDLVSVSAPRGNINNESNELRRSTRINAGVAKPRYGHENEVNKPPKSMVTLAEYPSNFHISVAKGLKEIGVPVEKAVMAELQQFINLGVFEPITLGKNNYKRKILRSSMFITEKLDANGKHLKWKARCVADGSTQEKHLYTNNASPTIEPVAVKTILKIAQQENRRIGVIDVTGAYLHADMDEEVIMSFDPKVTSVLEKLDSSVSKFKRKDGSLFVRLLKALYGCRQSGKLWYLRFTTFLKRIGFVENPAQPCVWNLMRNGKQITVGFHVDDNLITSELKENIDWFIKEIQLEFKDVKVQDVPVKTFLGMLVDTTKTEIITLCMSQLTKECLADIPQDAYASSPATKSLFDINCTSQLLGKKEQERFHSLVAKVRYLAENVRPDLNLVAAALSTRVTKPTQDDADKLYRALAYLNSTKELKLIIDSSPFDRVTAYIDASWGIHDDCSSHTGMTLTLGNTPVMFKSRKQQCITRSSTTAELVGLTDMMLNALSLHEFLEGQGLNCLPPMLLQDNESVIKIVASNGKSLKVKHLRIRQADVKQTLKNKEATLHHVRTKQMIADILTKPLQGELFRDLRNKVLGGGALDPGFQSNGNPRRD